MPTSTLLLKGKDLSIGYRQRRQTRPVQQHLDFELHRGQLTCLLGANGAGKSTLLRTLSASQPPLSGQLTLAGRPLSDYSERERSRTIGVVLTDKTQAGGLTVRELVALGRQPHTGFFGRLSADDEQKITTALEAVGIAHKAQRYTAELSDGERQKVFIAKALVQECPLILLDEPTAFLDVVSRIDILRLLHRLALKEQRAILLSTHDIDQALVLADRLWLLRPQGGLTTGTPEDLLLNGDMDTLFPCRDILFDRMHGVYSPAVQDTHRVVLEAADETLRHWTQNALNRYGYLCLSPDRAATSEGLPRLTVTSPHRLELTHPGTTVTFTSFAQMTTYLLNQLK